MCIIDCLSTIVFILPLHLDYTKVIILILWGRNFQLEYWRTFQLVSTLQMLKNEFYAGSPNTDRSSPISDYLYPLFDFVCRGYELG